MTLDEKEHSIEKIGGKWADLMQRGRQTRDARSAALMATKGLLNPHPAEDETVREELAQHTMEDENLLDRIITMVERGQELTNRQLSR